MVDIRHEMRGFRTYAPPAGTAAVAMLALILVIALPCRADADDIRVITNVETRDVYVGESFLMQISVDGADEADPPDFRAVQGFSVEYLGASNNSSQSISIVNGRVTRTVKKGIVFTYRLTPKEAGRLGIPSMDVNVAGTAFKTDPLTISVKRPEETEDFKLRIELSRDACYVGEPVVLKVVWYLNRDVESFNFTAPILESDAFDFEAPEVKIDPNRKYFRIPIGGSELIAEKGQGMLDGERYVTLTFRIALIPKRGGVFAIPEFIVACESGSGIRSRRDFFDDFFSDSYSGRWRGSLKKYVVPSNRLSLRVNELPIEGRPEGFAGHVGEYSIDTSAEPLEVSVGDPITLKITLEGPDYLGRIDLPPLSAQKGMAEDFKIPEERADGKIEGKKKLFTQTLRAKHDRVTGIPPIELIYFDTKKEEYVVARSDAIPLTVRPTRVVTAGDAEGIEQGPAGSPLEKWKEGIAYNYEGEGVLERQDLSLATLVSDVGMLLLWVVPVLLFAVLSGVRAIVVRRSSDPDAVRARGALRRLSNALKEAGSNGSISADQFNSTVMEALKEYLGDKLGRSGAALTAGETVRLLSGRGIDDDITDGIRGVFEECEMGAYAGGMESLESRQGLIARIRKAAARLDRKL